MARSFRWPLNRNRGFSATPRRSWSRRKPAASISLPAAKAIVRKAGPQEKESFVDSTLINSSTHFSAIYAAASTVNPPHTSFTLLAPSVWDQNLSSTRMSIRVDSVRIQMHMFHQQGAGNFGYYSQGQILLVAGTALDVTDDLRTNDENNWRTQAEVIGYEELPRGLRIVGRKYFKCIGPCIATDSNYENYIVNQPVAQIHYINTKRKFWLKKEEFLYMLVLRTAVSINGEASTAIGQLNGWHKWAVNYSRY